MNPRIIVGATAGVLGVILVVFTLTGTSVVSDMGGGFFSPSTQEVLPLTMDLFNFSVGEESFVTVIKTNDGFVILLVDEGGFTKAQTKALEKEEAKKILDKVLASGIAEFSRKEIKIWTDTYPTVQDELK